MNLDFLAHFRLFLIWRDTTTLVVDQIHPHFIHLPIWDSSHQMRKNLAFSWFGLWSFNLFGCHFRNHLLLQWHCHLKRRFQIPLDGIMIVSQEQRKGYDQGISSGTGDWLSWKMMDCPWQPNNNTTKVENHALQEHLKLHHTHYFRNDIGPSLSLIEAKPLHVAHFSWAVWTMKSKCQLIQSDLFFRMNSII